MAIVTAAGSVWTISPGAGGGRAWTPSSASTSLPSTILFQCKNRSLSSLFQRATDGRAARWPKRSEELLRGDAFKLSARGNDDRDDDAGVIRDMELYLDDLSLEYNSVWDTKPAWCQPWTIVASGVGAITTSWLLFHNLFVTGGVTFAIGLWWFSFLYAYPLAYSEMIAERRKMVKTGREDMYGREIGE